MKKVIMAMTIMGFASLPFYLKAQEKKEIEERVEVQEKAEKKEKKEKKEKAEKKETREIVIRSKGEKDLNLKVEINGDKITVNGKPLAEFKDDQVTINNRKMIIRDGYEGMAFNYSPDVMAFSKDFAGQWSKEGKEVTRPFLGVTTERSDEGAKIIEVSKESAAEKAGLKKDDIITKVGTEKIEDGEDLSEVIASKKAKEVVNVTYKRNGKENTVKATLGERKIKTAMNIYGSPRANVRSFSMPRVPNSDLVFDDRLAELGNLESAQGFNGSPYISFARQKRLGLKIQDTEEGGNVKVIDVEEGSAAEKAGLKKDDIITEIGGVKIENTDEAREQLMPSESKTAYTIKAKRNGAEMTFDVKFPKKLKTANL